MTNTIPAVLLRYVDGLRAHDVAKIAATVTEDLRFIGATRTLNKAQFVEFLHALYRGFPDWHYAYDAIECFPDSRYGIKWRQGGTHTEQLALPGIEPVTATGRLVRIPEHYFFYTTRGDLISVIHPEPIIGGAPRGILEQIGVALPPL